MRWLDYFDFKTETFTHYLNDPTNPQSLSFNQTVSLFIDRDQQLWVGTHGGGLNRLDLRNPINRDPAQAQFTIYQHDPQNPDSLSKPIPDSYNPRSKLRSACNRQVRRAAVILPCTCLTLPRQNRP